jgi:hypothetical protein
MHNVQLGQSSMMQRDFKTSAASATALPPSEKHNHVEISQQSLKLKQNMR